ncbi:MAG: N-acetylmuramoyl-L-alanine amidase [Pseudomonadota bacterium]
MPNHLFLTRFLTALSLLLAFATPSAYSGINTDLSIAIDVGHSPKRHGATSARGVGEYKFNQRIASLLHKQLVDIGFENAFLLTANNPEMPLMARASFAGARRADLLISIHHDSVQEHYLSKWEYQGKSRRYSDKFQGFSLFVSTQNEEYQASRIFAELLGEQLLSGGLKPTLHHAEKIPGESRPLLSPAKGVYQYDGLAILRHSKMPAVLVECGVIVNREEEARLNSPFYQQTLVAALVRGILKYASTTPPPSVIDVKHPLTTAAPVPITSTGNTLKKASGGVIIPTTPQPSKISK